ncbi:MAG: HEPN domain-containing protein [Candidatus Aenigmatarchaeota archaeon]
MRFEDKTRSRQRLKDAEEFLDSAFDNLNKERFKAALIDAGDCAIAANDAFTVFMIEEKASMDHREAVKLHKKAGQKISENKVRILQSLLELRHKEGYRSTAVGKNLARTAVMDAEIFLRWAKEKIKH